MHPRPSNFNIRQSCVRKQFQRQKSQLASSNSSPKRRELCAEPSPLSVNAPKRRPDLDHIRKNPGLYAQNCIDRNYPSLEKHAWSVVKLSEEWRAVNSDLLPLRVKSKQLREEIDRETKPRAQDEGEELEDGIGMNEAESLARGDIGVAKVVCEDLDELYAQRDQAQDGRERLIAEARGLKQQQSILEEREKRIQAELEALALQLPNLSSTDTPVGSLPEVIGYIGQHPDETATTESKGTRPLHHVEIGTRLGILDFEAASTTSGWGSYYLLNSAALLEQALIQHALQICTQRGFRLVSPPTMVYSHIAQACGFQPRDPHGEMQTYSISQRPHVMAGTAEIPLAALKANRTFGANQLPLKCVGVSRAYRAEAGARGVDARGLYRVHEFTKVEMFAWALPDGHGTSHASSDGNFATEGGERVPHSDLLAAEMLSIQKAILEPLGLHCRILRMPSHDLGASASSKIDIEAFFPSRREAGKDDGWGELTSLSNCTDYQSRRLNTKVGARDGKGSEFVHTLNGTAMAVPRVLAALLENGWDEAKGIVRVPECLRRWVGGREVIEREEL